MLKRFKEECVSGGLRIIDEEIEARVRERTAEIEAINADLREQVAERKRVEEALRASEARLAQAQRLAHVGSYEFAVPSGETIWSEETFRILGIDPARGAPCREDYIQFIHPEDRDAVRATVGLAMRYPEGYDYEYRIVLPDGTIKHIRSIGQPVMDDSGNLIKIFGTITDITPHALLYEAERAHATAEAEARAALQHHYDILQQSLIPQIPCVVEGYDVAARYIPLFGGLGVGGDFYDLFMTEEGKLGIVIGDVSGKGTRAAVIASDARSIIRAVAYKTPSAGTVLDYANSVLCGGQACAESFVTVFLAILDLVTGELCCSSAGHPPPAIRRGDGSVEMLDIGQPPLGLMERKRFAESRSLLNFGDKIVLYTDGVSEARGPEMLGIDGVGRCLEEHGGLRVEDIVDRLISAARDWAQGQLRDDVAVVALHRLGMVECRKRNGSAS